MTLVIEKRLYQKRRHAIVAAGTVGVAFLISAPFTYALTAHSPSTSLAKANAASHVAKNSAPLGATTSKTKGTNKVAAVVSSVIAPATDCTSSSPMHVGLVSANSSQLKKLAQYEQVCGSGIISHLSFFTPIPTTLQEAHDNAADVIAQLREFSSYGISPLVFLEPTTNSGLINMSEYRAGKYDAALDAYFATIKAAGITDTMMGTWVPFPEGNIPVWSSVDPNDFAASVTKTVTYQKKYFPASKASIMLDTLTYPTASSWDGGKAVSFLPYVQNIPAGLIDSVGLQGFPWMSPANEHGPSNGAPSDYLRVDLAAEMARALHVKDIWLNTGTLGVQYANKKGQQVTITPQQRLTQLSEVVDEVKNLQSQGFAVAVHLFAQDKSTVAEATDWSYWPTGHADTSPVTYVFKAFVHDLQATNADLWLFDTDETS